MTFSPEFSKLVKEMDKRFCERCQVDTMFVKIQVNGITLTFCLPCFEKGYQEATKGE